MEVNVSWNWVVSFGYNHDVLIFNIVVISYQYSWTEAVSISKLCKPPRGLPMGLTMGKPMGMPLQ